MTDMNMVPWTCLEQNGSLELGMSVLNRFGVLPFGEPSAHAELGPSGVVCFFNRLERSALPIDRRALPDGYGVSVLLAGSGCHIAPDGTEYELEPGVCFQFLSGKQARTLYRAGEPFCECSLFVYGELFEKLHGVAPIAGEPLAFALRDVERIVSAYLALYRCLSSGRARRSLEILRLLVSLHATIDEERSRERPSDPLVDELVDRLSADPLDRRSLPELAGRWGVAYHDLRRRFHAAVGVPIGQYRIQQRVEHARRLLASQSVQDVAARLGYPDAFSFSRQFRKHAGTSPSDYKRRLRPY
jgi:AraC-like DNA-binding protein